ncbi:MAG TPA: hypothetical protein VKW08_02985 [Xanthobacteraceae bacterium]|jgi:hypothetical protein|nr:hypothetical protein [Xanthobacteraceae bacterium]
MASIRTSFRSGIFVALTLVVCGFALASPARAADTCTGTVAQYNASIQQLQAYSAKANAMADRNPLYISDVEYYASALAQAQRCAKLLGPVAAR